MAKKKKTGKTTTIDFKNNMQVKNYINVVSALEDIPISEYILNLCIEDYNNPKTEAKAQAKQLVINK